MSTILFIDDDEQVRGLCQAMLEAAGHRVLTAETGHHGLQLSEEHEVNLALIDMFMPDMEGLEIIALLHLTRPDCKIIAMSGGSWSDSSVKAVMQLGANALLKKPFDLQELVTTVSAILK